MNNADLLSDCFGCNCLVCFVGLKWVCRPSYELVGFDGRFSILMFGFDLTLLWFKFDASVLTYCVAALFMLIY